MPKTKPLKYRERFLKIYANLPLSVREEVVCVVEDKPLTWNVAYLEVRNNTKLGEEILKKLADLEII